MFKIKELFCVNNEVSAIDLYKQDAIINHIFSSPEPKAHKVSL